MDIDVIEATRRYSLRPQVCAYFLLPGVANDGNQMAGAEQDPE
jgi:hypothetical protein